MDGTLGNLAYTLEDGREVTLSANYALLFKLRALKNDVYMRYNEAFKLVQKEPDYACASIIYAAYVMGVIGETGSAKNAMSEDDFLSKPSQGFREAFIAKTQKPKRCFRVPRFELETIEDAYTFYVLILGLSEVLFWTAPISTLRTVADDKTAYDGWRSSEQERLSNQRK